MALPALPLSMALDHRLISFSYSKFETAYTVVWMLFKPMHTIILIHQYIVIQYIILMHLNTIDISIIILYIVMIMYALIYHPISIEAFIVYELPPPMLSTIG